MNGVRPDVIVKAVVDQASLATVTAFASGTCICVYLGQAHLADGQAIANIDLIVNLTTLYVAGTWAEIAIASSTGNFPGNANGSLTIRGFTNVAAVYNAGAGPKKTTVAVTGIVNGMHLWAVFGSLGGTQFQVRGGLADDLQSGVVQTVAVRPSTWATPQAAVLGGAALVPPVVYASCR